MKTQRLIMLSGLMVLFFLHSSFKGTTILNFQEPIVIEAVYDGHEDYGYNFLVTRNDDEEYTITFQEVKMEVLKAFDLDSEDLLGKTFKITYTTEVIVSIDDDGYENEEEVNTIIKLEKL